MIVHTLRMLIVPALAFVGRTVCMSPRSCDQPKRHAEAADIKHLLCTPGWHKSVPCNRNWRLGNASKRG